MTPPGNRRDTVTVVVPVLNEEASIDDFLERMASLDLLDALIMVDNASTDGTVDRIARHPRVRLLRNDRNIGYGGSIRRGLAAAETPAVVIIDADLEYPPEAIPDLLDALRTHPVVYGSRFSGRDPADMPWARRLGNRLISSVFNVLFQQATSDLYTGMKALRREAVAALALSRNGFDHVAEMAVQLADAGFEIHDVAVAYAPRTRGVSKMRHLREALAYAGLITRYWFRYRVTARR